jgi:hypothetical protein
MALVYFDGFQDHDVMPKPEWGGGAPTCTTGRDGTVKGAAQTTATASSLTACTFPSSASPMIIGIAGKVSNLVTASSTWLSILGVSATVQLSVTVNTAGFVEIRKGGKSGTLLGTSTGHTPIATGSFYHLQAKTVLHLTSGSCDVRLNNVPVVSVSGVSTATLTENVGGCIWGAPGTGGITMTVDDLWAVDTTGATANDFLGDIKVKSLFPSADGDQLDWTPSTGTQHSLTVDETTINTTDYVSDTVGGHRDLYQVDDLDATAVTVYGVRETIYCSKNDAGNALLKPVLKETGGTVTSETAQGLTLAWNGVYGTLRATRPSDGSAWTVSEVNALQVGVETG